MRRFALPLSLGMALLAGSGAIANDQVYKCVDPNGVMVLSDKPCAVVAALPAAPAAPAAVGATTADAAATPDSVAALPAVEQGKPAVVKEYYTLPPADFDHGQWKKPPVSTPPKVDVATLKAARLKLELEDKTAVLRQASLD